MTMRCCGNVVAKKHEWCVRFGGQKASSTSLAFRYELSCVLFILCSWLLVLFYFFRTTSLLARLYLCFGLGGLFISLPLFFMWYDKVKVQCSSLGSVCHKLGLLNISNLISIVISYHRTGAFSKRFARHKLTRLSVVILCMFISFLPCLLF